MKQIVLWPFVLAMGVHLVSGVVALLCDRWRRLAVGIATAGCVLASVLGLAASGYLLLCGGSGELQVPWQVPVGALRLGVDALSAFFLFCIHLVSGLAALFGVGYLQRHGSRARLGPVLFFFSLLTASMVGVVLARDGVLFIVCWEVMSLAGFFLITFDHGREEVRRAGFVYLIASHVGVVFLLVLFVLLATPAGDFGFAAMKTAAVRGPVLANACFLLALVGFGTKAGFWVLHAWLPEAHPAAPSHVSATMSGVMIKLGIYGLLRTLTFLGPPPPWWGVLLVLVGALSAVLGVLHALAQHDLKRLLAYHSVENIGIIVLGVGLGLLGQSRNQPTVALLGYSGAILHTLNHGLFKGLLFHGAGSILLATGTKEIDAQGGLARRMPVTAATFLVASIAISGLPPLNGFVSEWLIYLAAFRGGSTFAGAEVVAALLVVPTLALVGGLAAACFVKAYGVVFLGEPRTQRPDAVRDPPWVMLLPMVVGAGLCVGIGLWPDAAFRLVERPAQSMLSTATPFEPLGAVLVAITRVGVGLLGTTMLLASLRYALMRRRPVGVGPTWGCGYEAPSPRMQYSASSFAEPVLEPFNVLLHRPIHEVPPNAYFPDRGSYERHPGDMAGERIIVPATQRLVRLLGKLRAIQHGRVQVYLLYILLTVVALLVWQLSGASR